MGEAALAIHQYISRKPACVFTFCEPRGLQSPENQPYNLLCSVSNPGTSGNLTRFRRRTLMSRA